MIGSVPFLGRSFLVYYGTDYTIATNAVSSPSRGFYVSLFVRSFQQQRVTRFRPLLGVPISQFIGGFALALGAVFEHSHDS